MTPNRKETDFMTNREMIREMYARTKNTEDMVANMKGDVSVLSTVQKIHSDEIKSLKTWRNINVAGILSAIATAIGIKV